MDKNIIILLSSLKNGIHAGLKNICIKKPLSKSCIQLLNILYEKGFIRGFKFIINSKNKIDGILIFFKYDNAGLNTIESINIISKPGRKVYISLSNLWKHDKNSIIYILSTPKGLLTDVEARFLNVSGELICSIH